MSTEGHFCKNCWCDYNHGCICDVCDLTKADFEEKEEA